MTLSQFLALLQTIDKSGPTAMALLDDIAEALATGRVEPEQMRIVLEEAGILEHDLRDVP